VLLKLAILQQGGKRAISAYYYAMSFIKSEQIGAVLRLTLDWQTKLMKRPQILGFEQWLLPQTEIHLPLEMT
jgi:hypothetical protein